MIRNRMIMAMFAAFAFLAGCWATKPYDPNVLGGQYYLCCNMSVNRDHDASDANYVYTTDAQMLPYGTKVVVTRVAANRVAFLPLGETSVVYLYYRHGSAPAKEYFDRILLTHDPRDAVRDMDPAMVEAIGQGHLLPGMTKEQAILARGYPPMHRTPSIEADEWIYYENFNDIDRVKFTDGKITAITREQ